MATPHEEHLGQLDTPALHMQKIAVVEDLHAKIGELEISAGIEGGAETLQIVIGKALVQQLCRDAFFLRIPGDIRHNGSSFQPA